MTAQLRMGLLLFLAILVAAMWALTFISKHQERVISGVVFLPEREFEALSLVAVGTGGTFENHLRRGPALLIGQGRTAALVDAGRGVSEALRAAEIPADQPRQLFLTSLAPENVLGLDALWIDGWMRDPELPLQVTGPPGTAAWIAQLERAHRPAAERQADAFGLAPVGGRIVVAEWRGGEERTIGAITVRCAAVSGGLLPALAYRFEGTNAGAARAIVVATSGNDPDAVAGLAAGAHLLALEAVYGASLDMAEQAGEASSLETLRAEAAHHLRLEAVGTLADRAGVHGLLLTRLRPPPVFAFQYENLVHETFRGGPVVIAEDGEALAP